MTKKDKVIALVGPTASGKTSLAVMIAKKLNTQIISADSRQIYKEFNIAAAKPTNEEQSGIKHHLIDIVTPDEEYTVANFAQDAKKIIKNLTAEKKIPIIAGGTGLYFRTLLQDFDIPKVAPDKELRNELKQIAEKQGTQKLYEMLCELDIETAKKIHPNNTVKIIRAIEVTKKLNQPMSQAQKRKEPEYETLWIGLNAENRQFLYDRINHRVDAMIENGLEAEAKYLFEKYGNLKILMNTIGYEEFFEYFQGEKTLSQTISLIKQNNRRYAKRQLKWFRQNSEINWFDIETEKDIFQKVLEKTLLFKDS